MTPASLRVSVVIPNYNYERYIADAIDSALALDWPRVEVIVVDDGSTDHSRRVIEAYGSRVRAIFQENQGQVGACNAGFAVSSGDMVLFLDSDDFVEPGLIREAAAVWRPGVSKVQFQMRSVDAAGEPIGSFLPQFHIVPSPEDVRLWAAATGTYPTPPGSGNVYSREYLQKIFPLDHQGGRAADSCCIAAAPYLGDVITVPKPLVSYRIHGANDGAFTGMDVPRFGREVTRARMLFGYSRNVAARAGIQVNEDAIRYSLTLLPYRLVSRKLAPKSHPWPDDSELRIVLDLMVAMTRAQGFSLSARSALLVWCVCVTLCPRPVADRLVLWRFAAGSRPKVLLKALKLIRVLR